MKNIHAITVSWAMSLLIAAVFAVGCSKSSPDHNIIQPAPSPLVVTPTPNTPPVPGPSDKPKIQMEHFHVGIDYVATLDAQVCSPFLPQITHQGHEQERKEMSFSIVGAKMYSDAKCTSALSSPLVSDDQGAFAKVYIKPENAQVKQVVLNLGYDQESNVIQTFAVVTSSVEMGELQFDQPDVFATFPATTGQLLIDKETSSDFRYSSSANTDCQVNPAGQALETEPNTGAQTFHHKDHENQTFAIRWPFEKKDNGKPALTILVENKLAAYQPSLMFAAGIINMLAADEEWTGKDQLLIALEFGKASLPMLAECQKHALVKAPTENIEKALAYPATLQVAISVNEATMGQILNVDLLMAPSKLLEFAKKYKLQPQESERKYFLYMFLRALGLRQYSADQPFMKPELFEVGPDVSVAVNRFPEDEKQALELLYGSKK
ncbi:MAG: hypothetical protein R3A11_04575 [Bdellovibrionota bacterium]